MVRAKKHYVNNKTLYLEMIKYRERCEKAEADGKLQPILPNYVGECFLMICNKLATKPNFAGYTYRDEMIADAIENCVSAAAGFDPDKSTNPFAYFTQIAWNAFIRRIAKEKKQSYIKHKNFEHSNLLTELSDEGRVTGQPIPNEYSSQIIKSFEEKLTKTQKKSRVGVEKFVEE